MPPDNPAMMVLADRALASRGIGHDHHCGVADRAGLDPARRADPFVAIVAVRTFRLARPLLCRARSVTSSWRTA